MLNTDLDKITSSHRDDGLLHSLFHHIVGLRMGFKNHAVLLTDQLETIIILIFNYIIISFY